MQSELDAPDRVVGLKQSTEAIKCGRAKSAYCAQDADGHVRLPFLELCRANNVPVEFVETKQKLGKMCGINIGAACAVVLK